MTRFVVTVRRWDWLEADLDMEYVVVGPFRSRERAEDRARVIRTLAEKYEDLEGVVGPDNALEVNVARLEPGVASAERALSLLYGSVVPDA